MNVYKIPDCFLMGKKLLMFYMITLSSYFQYEDIPYGHGDLRPVTPET